MMRVGHGWLYLGALSPAEQRAAQAVTELLLRRWNRGWHERAIRIAALERAGIDATTLAA